MKKTIYIVATLLALASCKDFLNEELEGGYTAENFYVSETQAELAVNAIYNALYDNTLWIFGDVASDDSVKGGNSGDQADINYINDFTASSDNGCIDTYWQDTYEIISRANNVIANIPSVDMDEDDLNRMLGEAYFLRAYAYFNLVNIFGEVPLKTKPQTTSSAIHVGLSSVEDIYAQIDEDLEFATENLPASYSSDVGRATSGAAWGLLAKSKLFQEDWQSASDCCDEVIGSGLYSLVHDYANLFEAGAEDSSEVVFCIRYGNTSEASLGNNLNVWFSPAWEGGYYFNAPTEDFVSIFTETTEDGDVDPRLDASIGRDGYPWYNDTTFLASWSEATGYLVKKYDEDLSDDYAKAQCTIPQHILRYADVLLMKAEAENELGNTSTAANYLDQVRARVGIAATTATTQSALRTAIRLERRKELCFEFHRFFDIMRYGSSYAQSAIGLSWTDTRFYFPLPQAELDTNQAL